MAIFQKPKVANVIGKAGSFANQLLSKIPTSVKFAINPTLARERGITETAESIGGYWGQMNPFNPPSANAGELPAPYSTYDPYKGTQSTQGYPNPTPSGDGQVLGASGDGLDLGGDIASWDVARKALEGEGSTLDQSYGLSSGDINRGITETESAGRTQQDTVNKRYGEILANQLRTYQDLGRQRMGTFSSLGTLDSSAFGEQTARADQSLAEGRRSTEENQASDNKSIDDQVYSYRKAAQSALAKLGLEYQSGKNAIATALASNDIEAASAIKSKLDQIKSSASYLASTLTSGARTTSGNIGNVTGNTFADQMSKYLSSLTASGNALYTLPTASTPQFVGPDGRTYKSKEDYLAQNGIA